AHLILHEMYISNSVRWASHAVKAIAFLLFTSGVLFPPLYSFCPDVAALPSFTFVFSFVLHGF
ncbi:hypothetical protein, partial [uncultured Bacteroides sp.]|uniref:hypothetical protein n=1 Tax=uncultured Bacteroides sp. TaxID=162156 RepID=UPI00272B8F56